MKTTPLRSEEQLTPEDWKKIAIASVNQALEEDRDQAYIRLVDGIERMTVTEECDDGCGGYCQEMGCRSIENVTINETLKDILENVVKPLYNKTGDKAVDANY